MGNVLNLGRARKRKQQAAEKQRAEENAIRHGRTRAERKRERMEQARLQATFEGARLELVPAPAPNADDETNDGEATDDEPEAPPTR